MDCDISVHNALALANTRLLYLYGEIDPRVRALAYIIKHWAKRRHINSPLDGTLSSYGFLLTILHFLQRRPVPLLPSLQQLPPHWAGQRFDSQVSQTQPMIPRVWERNAAENKPCNIYFLSPSPEQMDLLKVCYIFSR
jgi:DNA polymerase sigma